MNRRNVSIPTALFAVLALATALVTGCSATPSSSPAPTTEPDNTLVQVTETVGPAATVAATATGPVRLADLKLGLVKKWSGLKNPLYLTHAGDGSGRVFIVEQGGLIKVVEGGAVQAKPYLDLRSKVSTGGERGLLGLAFSPKFKTDGRIYVNYTDTSGNTVIARYTAPVPSDSTPSWGASKRLMYIKQPYPNHNGGCLQFGPDGYLYIGMGDGGSGGDPGNRAQNKGVFLGKMLRIDVSKEGAVKPYLIPATNPAKLTKSSALKPALEVWALGVRNPWRFSFDANGGNLWLADVGQNAYEEVNVVTQKRAATYGTKGGMNFGWRKYEGLHYYPSLKVVPLASRSSKYIWPTFNVHHPTGESITGGYVYRGKDYPALVGTYLFADYLEGWVAGIRLRAPDGSLLTTREVRTLMTTPYLPSSFGVDERNELYLVDHRGSVFQVTGTPK